ncbi:hypothetical protein [Lewinella sp. IMCC34183]|uniref:hypothetical protein n=1 Tax=Lewinella sp. IMCC34183 TaxID=2248762 RepID=UPI000E25991E|nr:hypothetical protein [Lewinella sp. IMCC34183]
MDWKSTLLYLAAAALLVETVSLIAPLTERSLEREWESYTWITTADSLNTTVESLRFQNGVGLVNGYLAFPLCRVCVDHRECYSRCIDDVIAVGNRLVKRGDTILLYASPAVPRADTFFAQPYFSR